MLRHIDLPAELFVLGHLFYESCFVRWTVITIVFFQPIQMLDKGKEMKFYILRQLSSFLCRCRRIDISWVREPIQTEVTNFSSFLGKIL